MSVQLTPLHAFIGPNDSGTTTLLRAIYALSRFATDVPTSNEWFPGFLEPPAPIVVPHRWLAAASASGGTYSIEWRMRADSAFPHDVVESASAAMRRKLGTPSGLAAVPEARDVLQSFGPAVPLYFDPAQLRLPGPRVANAEDLKAFFERRGVGLAAVLASLILQAPDWFPTLREQVSTLFPTIAQLQVKTDQSGSLSLEVELKSGARVPAAHMSEGLLYYLAFLVSSRVHGAKLLLVEEPENGLHPARIREVVGLLREVSKSGTQVLMATHSPLVINELEPDEVSLVTRTEEKGTIVTPIKDTKNFEQRKEVFALGELWLSYADGVAESELVGE
ncbi:MAG: ATP-binding protein [Sandaracinaceae bacterium]|nr:ATP-binding protein [Sandaracinaceae bacterium]